MKRKLLLLALAFTSLAPLAARAENEVSFEFFYDNLSPYGEWVEVGDYGTCWRPRGVDEEWSPYTDGYWSYTDAGWTWISYEDFGDICYHYGRWVRVNDVGWCWVPDYEWGPAWVSWRKSDEYIGWAPLPPEAHWRSSVGFSVWVDDYYDIGPTYYSYCPVVEFSAPVIRHVCVPRHRAIGLFGLTVNITNITYNSYNRHVFCGGPDYYTINRVVRRPVPALKLVQNTTIINNNVTIVNNQRVVRPPRNLVAGNTLQVFAPKVVNKPAAVAVKPQITQVVAKPKIDKGWAGIADPGQKTKLREKVKLETKGLTPETAPAKPVAVADLKPLPDKPDTSAPSPVQVAPRVGKGGKGAKPETLPPAIAKPSLPTAPVTKPAIDKPVPPIVEPSTSPAKKAGKIAGKPEKPAAIPQQPAVMPQEKTPGGATEGASRSPKNELKPGKTKRPAGLTPLDEPPVKPAPTTSVPLTKPFRETTPPATIERAPVAPPKSMKSDDAERIARQRQDAAAAQQRMTDQADRQRAAAANAERLRQAQEDSRRRQMESQRPPQPKIDLSEQRQRQAEAARAATMQRQAEAAQRNAALQKQAEAAQRQAVMQRQAEAQQRAIQAQRQEAVQRQQPPRSAQPPPSMRVPSQSRPPVPAPSGASRGKQLTPEQLEELKKRK